MHINITCCWNAGASALDELEHIITGPRELEEHIITVRGPQSQRKSSSSEATPTCRTQTLALITPRACWRPTGRARAPPPRLVWATPARRGCPSHTAASAPRPPKHGRCEARLSLIHLRSLSQNLSFRFQKVCNRNKISRRPRGPTQAEFTTRELRNSGKHQ
jgi:hypothetical protein